MGIMPSKTPRNTVKVRRNLPKVGEEVLLRAKVRRVRDSVYPGDNEIVVEIDGVLVGAPVRVLASKIAKPE